MGRDLSQPSAVLGSPGQAGLLPIVVGAHSGAFDLVPYDAPEDGSRTDIYVDIWIYIYILDDS
jgi:hypothetical protein